MSQWLKVLSTMNTVSHNHSFLRYLKKIGSGGFAEVFEVQDSQTQLKYALKIVDKKQIKNSNLLSRINEEVHIHRSLESPFIIKCHKSWQTECKLFILLELAEGGDLFTVWRKHRTLPKPSVCRYIAQVAGALHHLHKNEIVYRDLKLENILLSDEGGVKLSDFGLAGKLGKGKYDLTFCGTMEYMSPEMLAASFYSHSTDFWSLGVLAYCLLMGRYPYQPEPNYNEMLYKVSSQRPSYSSLGRSCRSLLDGLLEVSAKKRINSFEELKHHSYFRDIDFGMLHEIRGNQFQQFPFYQRRLLPDIPPIALNI